MRGKRFVIGFDGDDYVYGEDYVYGAEIETPVYDRVVCCVPIVKEKLQAEIEGFLNDEEETGTIYELVPYATFKGIVIKTKANKQQTKKGSG